MMKRCEAILDARRPKAHMSNIEILRNASAHPSIGGAANETADRRGSTREVAPQLRHRYTPLNEQ
jgi:hypothetical protein